MDVSKQDARQSLELIEGTTVRTRKAIASRYASSLLILWGLIWALGFMLVHFWPRRGGQVFWWLDAVGIAATILIGVRLPSRTSVRSAATSKVLWRMFGFWFLLFAYGIAWTLLLRPVSGTQVCAFFCTIVMLGYVVIGLWSGSFFMFWLGLAVTALTFLGYYALPDYFFLWMSPTGGGALLGTGLYIRIRWR